MPDTHMTLSVLIPFYNEEGSLAKLYDQLRRVLETMGCACEIVFINDGSTDSSLSIVTGIQQKDPRVRIISSNKNTGKAKALNDGFHAATGDVIITMDADLQDDPSEIPHFLQKMDEGYDLVSGWKKKRHDPLEKRIPSKLFNKVTSLATGLKLHDFNCGFKAYRREIFTDIQIYGELHRYIPPLAHWLGYRVGEIPVQHHPREHGKSKYGWERYFRGFFDLFTVQLLTKYVRSPIFFFGILGLIVLGIGLATLTGITYLQVTYGSTFGHRPLTYFSVLAILFGSQSLSLGLLAELLTSISQKKGRTRISIRSRLVPESGKGPKGLSVVVPLHNECESLPELHDRVTRVLANLTEPYEIVYVDDGSIDGSAAVLRDIYQHDANVSVIILRKRFGKASALQAGFDNSTGTTIVTLDADLQDRPEEIPRFLEKIELGNDLVLGRRTNIPFFRGLYSRLFNRIVSTVSGVRIGDVNCGFKAFRRSVIDGVRLYGEFQRFFPILVAKKGVKMVEIPVVHHERKYGKSKYGISRIPKAFLDLLAVVLLVGYGRRPLHLFGAVGVVTGMVGFAINAYLTVLKLWTGTIGNHNTLLLIGVMLMVLGLQWFSTGILSELINNYFMDDSEPGRTQ